MSSLADLANASLSRLSHLVKRLEERGLVRREPDPADGRFTNAILTDEGFQTLAAAAPGHVAHVRSLVIDVLSPEQLRRLGLAADRIMSRIDTSEIDSPHPPPVSRRISSTQAPCLVRDSARCGPATLVAFCSSTRDKALSTGEHMI